MTKWKKLAELDFSEMERRFLANTIPPNPNLNTGRINSGPEPQRIKPNPAPQ